MSEVLNELQHAWTHIEGLHINPWAAAIIAALLAAFMEQRRAARRAAPFTEDHIGAAGQRPR
jgi:hypothetical protein